MVQDKKIKQRMLTGAGLLLGGILLVVILIRISAGPLPTPAPPPAVPEKPVIHYEFGIPTDSFRQEIAQIKPNQFLSDLLLERGISYATIDQLARRSKPIFDVARIKAGNHCHFFFLHDSVSTLKHMVYEISDTSYLVYTFGDSLQIRTGEKKVQIKEAVVAGEIITSPWNAMLDMKVSTHLAIELENIYAWTVDFFGLNRGDRFVIYHQNRYVDSTYIGIGKVFATRLTHRGRDHYAFLFTQDGIESYYNEKGESLRRSFLKAPLKSYRISSRYSNSRMHPILRIRRPHHGVDYAAPQGTPVFAIGDGKVVKVSYDKASGNYIKIKHNSVYTSGYMHLVKRPAHNVGDYVKQGDIIGYVGMTGYATGPHLDFRIWKNGHTIDPLKVKAPPVKPVKQALRPRFDSIARIYRQKLDQYSDNSLPIVSR